MESIDTAGKQIMEQQGTYFIKRDQMDGNHGLKERTRLQHCNLFKNLKMFYVDYFGFLQKSDLLPDAIQKHLDFRLNDTLHLCNQCLDKFNKVERISFRPEKPKDKWELTKRESLTSSKSKRKSSSTGQRDEVLSYDDARWFSSKPHTEKGGKKITQSSFVIVPKTLEFYNCEIGKTYKKTLKLINTDSFTQSLVVKDFPKSRTISIDVDLNSKLASGLSCWATVTYKPEVHRNFQDVVTFRNQMGFVKCLPITVARRSPRLIVCIFKSNSYYLNRPKPGSARFSEVRREALNSSIDCGSCLVGEHVYLSMFVQNKGMKARFFIITEDEWYFENIETISKSMEFSSDTLWIYPTFFELDHDETIQISILFFPSKSEMFLEKFYLMCDNNSYQQIEVLGDGLMFNKKLLKIDVPPNDVEIEKKEDYCIFLGTLPPNSSYPLTLTVHNTSALVLKCYWKFRNKTMKDVCDIDSSWINMEKDPKVLAPYSTTDFQFKINFDAKMDGLYSIYFNLLVADVPIMSLERDVKYLIMDKRNTKKTLTKCVDVYFTEFEVACNIENPVEEDSTTSSDSETSSADESSSSEPKLKFSSPFLEFGILPSGLCVQRPFWVHNLSLEPVRWKIVEVKYNIDSPPFMETIGSKNISCAGGEFYCVCQEKKIFYNITNKMPISWVSMLLLITVDQKETQFEIESVCIVTYEIINYDITINGISQEPVVCPMKVLYTGVPHTLTFTIENHSPITGLFYFLKPYGESAQFVNTELTPNCATIKPLESKSVEMKITGNDVGIFEDFFIPCFVNRGQECIALRLLCAVDTIHLTMYLPGVNNYYQKVTWPPKIVFEYDDNWMICPCTLEYSPSFELDEMSPQTSGQMISRTDSRLSPSKIELKLAASASHATTNEEVIVERSYASSVDVSEEEVNVVGSESNSKSASVSMNSSESDSGSLRRTLCEKFGDELFLQDQVVEVFDVQLRTPKKITFYLENITPVQSSYTVEATNFSTTKSFDNLRHTLKLKKTEDIYNDMISNEYGILVLSDVKEAELPAFGVAEVNLTIFANTWGIYQEEIAVDVVDTPCFTFSLLIEVVGCPIVFPMALSKITDHPTVRFGTVPYYSDPVERNIKIVNTSIVPIKLLWHPFLKTSSDEEEDLKFNATFDITSLNFLQDGFKVDITDSYYGTESNNLFTITPRETTLKKNSSDFVTVSMTPETVLSQLEKTYVRCTVIGHIFIEDHYRKKPNYFFRPSSLENLNLRMEVLSVLELPILKPDFVCGEASLRIYANDVIINKSPNETMRLVFQNLYYCGVKAEINLDDPFEILSPTNKKYGGTIDVKPLSCIEIIVSCNIDHQRLLQLSEVVYPKKGEEVNDLKEKYNVQSIDTSHKILHMRRNLKISQRGRQEQAYPLSLYIHFPHISAKPTVVKLDQILVGNTYKTLVTVFNHTGCLINFEIFKSLASEVLFITPHYGQIEKSTGVNLSFVNIFIYFTARETRPYQESIRIVTNIPNYFLEIPIKATGSINEKFHKDYKI